MFMKGTHTDFMTHHRLKEAAAYFVEVQIGRKICWIKVILALNFPQLSRSAQTLVLDLQSILRSENI